MGWCTPAPAGSGKQFVREHNPRHARLIHETLEQFAQYPGEWHDFVQWFYDMPLFVDAGRIATGRATIEDLGWELFHYYLDVASGKKHTWAASSKTAQIR